MSMLTPRRTSKVVLTPPPGSPMGGRSATASTAASPTGTNHDRFSPVRRRNSFAASTVSALASSAMRARRTVRSLSAVGPAPAVPFTAECLEAPLSATMSSVPSVRTAGDVDDSAAATPGALSPMVSFRQHTSDDEHPRTARTRPVDASATVAKAVGIFAAKAAAARRVPAVSTEPTEPAEPSAAAAASFRVDPPPAAQPVPPARRQGGGFFPAVRPPSAAVVDIGPSTPPPQPSHPTSVPSSMSSSLFCDDDAHNVLPFPVDSVALAPVFEPRPLLDEGSLRFLLRRHFRAKYAHLSVVGAAHAVERSTVFSGGYYAVVASDSADFRSDQAKRYGAETLCDAAGEYGRGTVVVEGPPGIGKSSLLKHVAREQHVGGDAAACVLVELRQLAVEAEARGWARITSRRLLDVGLQGWADKGVPLRAIRTALLRQPIAWLLDGFDEAWSATVGSSRTAAALRHMFTTFLFPDVDTGQRPQRSAAGHDVVVVTSRFERSIVEHPLLAAAPPGLLLRLEMPRWRRPEVLAFVDHYFQRIAADPRRPPGPSLTERHAEAQLLVDDPRFVAWEGVPLMCDAMCHLAATDPTFDRARSTPAVVLDASLRAIFDRNLRRTVAAAPWAMAVGASPTQALDALFKAALDHAMHYALAIYQGRGSGVPLDLHQAEDATAVASADLSLTVSADSLQLSDDGSAPVVHTGRPRHLGDWLLATSGWCEQRFDAGTTVPSALPQGGPRAVPTAAARHLSLFGDKEEAPASSLWYFRHRCFVESLAARALAAMPLAEFKAWLHRNVTLAPEQRLVLALLAHRLRGASPAKPAHAQALLGTVHKHFVANYLRDRDEIRAAVLPPAEPSLPQRLELFRRTGALVATEVSVQFSDTRIGDPPKHLGLVPHLRNPCYFFLLLEPAARFGAVDLLTKIRKALAADKRFTPRLASQCLAQALAHAPASALRAQGGGNGGLDLGATERRWRRKNDVVATHDTGAAFVRTLACLAEGGVRVAAAHACECASLPALQHALGASQLSATAPALGRDRLFFTAGHTVLPAADLDDAVRAAVDSDFPLGLTTLLHYSEDSVASGKATRALLCHVLALCLGRAVVFGQPRCFHAAMPFVTTSTYELTVVAGEAPYRAGTARSDAIELTIGEAQQRAPPLRSRHVRRLVSTIPSTLTALDVTGSAVEDDALEAVAEHCPQLRSLCVSAAPHITDTGVLFIARRCPALTALDISDTGGRITDVSLHAVAQHCMRLRTVDLSANPVGPTTLTSAGVLALAQRCPLRSVIATATPFDDDTIAGLAAGGSMLQQLALADNHGSVSDGCIHRIAPSLRNLLTVDLSGAEGAITDAGLVTLSAHCSRLTSVSIAGSGGAITDAGLVPLAEGCRGLELLDAQGCAAGDDGLFALAALPALRVLHLTGTRALTAAGVDRLATHCTTLQSLSIDGPHGITAVGVQACLARCPPGAHVYLPASTAGRVVR